MKKQLRAFILGILVAFIFMSVTIFAESITQQIEVLFNAINIKVNGTDVTVDNILYNGTTYVPLRAVSKMLDKKVGWDPETGTASINDDEDEVDEKSDLLTINGQAVSVKDYKFYLNYIKKGMERQAAQSGIEDVWELDMNGVSTLEFLKQEALNAIIREKIEKQQATEKGITLTEDDYQLIAAEKETYKDNLGGEDNLKKYLSEIGFTEEGFIKHLENERLFNKLYEHITQIDGDAEISIEQAKDYYEDNMEEFKQVTAKHILFSIMDEEGQVFSEEEQEEVKKKAESVYKDIKSGKNFDELMEEYSEDPGLEMYPEGYTFGKGEMIKEFEETAFELKTGEVSNLVKTDYGYHIIKVTEEAYYLPYEDVEEQIIDRLEYDRYNDNHMKYLLESEKWQNEAIIEIDEAKLNLIKVK